MDNRLPGYNRSHSSEVVRIGGPRRTQLAEQSHKNDSDEVRRMENSFLFVILKNGENGSISMPGSVSTNRHVRSKRYEPSNVSVRCGTHFFTHLRILWIPKS